MEHGASFELELEFERELDLKRCSVPRAHAEYELRLWTDGGSGASISHGDSRMTDWEFVLAVIVIGAGVKLIQRRSQGPGVVPVSEEERDSGLAALASSRGWHLATESDPGTLPAWFSDALSNTRWAFDGTAAGVHWVAWCVSDGRSNPSWMTTVKADLGRKSRYAVRLASPPKSKILARILFSETIRKQLVKQLRTKMPQGAELSAEEYASVMTMDPAKAATPPDSLVTRKFTAAAVRDSAAFLKAVAPAVVEYFDRAQETAAGKNYLSVVVMENEVIVSVDGIIDRPDDVGRLIAVGIAAITAA